MLCSHGNLIDVTLLELLEQDYILAVLGTCFLEGKGYPEHAAAPYVCLQMWCRVQDDSLSASELAAQEERKPEQAATPPTAEALGAVMSLLEACLSTGHMPTPEEAVSDAQKDGGLPDSPKAPYCSSRCLTTARIASPAHRLHHEANVLK